MWFALSLLAGLLFAINKIIFRKVFTKEVNPIGFNSAHEFIAGALLLPIALINFTLPHSNKAWVGLILGAFFIFVTDIYSALSLNKIEVSVYQIVGQLRHIIALFGGYLLFKEGITPTKVISILLIMIGVTIAIRQKTKATITRGVIDAFISTVAIGVALLMIKLSSQEVQPAVSASICLMTSGILSYFVLLATKAHPYKLIPKAHVSQLIIAALIFAVFELASFQALKLGEASRVIPVIQSSLIFSLVGGYIFLHERQRMSQKIIGSLIIAAGIGLLYLV